MPQTDRPPVRLCPPPACSNAHLLLYAIRRMAGGGLGDAYAVNALMGSFGLNFRRPLVLLRALMAELARVSMRQIAVAPCCCVRVTPDEAELIIIVATASDQPTFAHMRLCRLLDIDHSLGALTSAQAINQAFADLGRPLELADQSDALSEPAFPID